MTEKKYELILEDKRPGLHRIRALRDIPKFYVKKGDIGGSVQGEHNLSHEGDCWVDKDACVYGNARVEEAAFVTGRAKVSGNARIQEDAVVMNDAHVSGDVTMKGKSGASDDAILSGELLLEGRVVVRGDAVVNGYDMILSGSTDIFEQAYLSGYGTYESVEICGNAEVRQSDRRAKVAPGVEITSGMMSSADLRWSQDVLTISPIGSERGMLTVYRGILGWRMKRGCFNGTIEEFKEAVDVTHSENKWIRERYEMTIDYVAAYIQSVEEEWTQQQAKETGQ